MKIQTPLKQYITVIVITLALVLGASAIQAAWTAPTLPPPDGNVDAPINVGLNTQSKLGQLLVNTSVSNPYAIGMAIFGKVGIGTATPVAKLDVVSGASDETGLRVRMNNTSNNTFSINFDRAGTNVQSSFNWQTNGVNKWNMGQDNDGTEDIKFYDWTSNRFFMKWFSGTADVGMGKNSKSLYVQYSSDAAGTLDGNVGIGTITPTAKLEVAGQVKITGGSPGAGKVLTSDANGLATWQTPSGGGGSGNVISAYVNWNRNAGIRPNSYNISSVSAPGTRPTVYFTNPMLTTTYLVVCSGLGGSAAAGSGVPMQFYATTKETTYFEVEGHYASAEDYVNVINCIIID